MQRLTVSAVISVSGAVVSMLGACSSSPVCEVAPSPWDAATNIAVEVRGDDHGARAVFVQNAAGEILLDTVTSAEGTLAIDEIPADAFLTIDVPDNEPHFITYVALESNDTIVVDSNRIPSPALPIHVTIRFPQLDVPDTAHYDIGLGDLCASASVDHDPTAPPGLVREAIVQCATTSDFASVIAVDSSYKYLAASGAAYTGGSVVDVTGSWAVGSGTLEVTASEPLSQVQIYGEHAGTLRNFEQYYQPPAGTQMVLPVTNAAIDATWVGVYFSEREYAVRTTSSELTVGDPDLLPAVGGIDATSDDHGGFEVSWSYRGPRSATVAWYLIGISGDRVFRQVVSHGDDCSASAPPLPDRYRIPRPAPGVTVGEDAGVDFIYGDGLSRAAARRFLHDDHNIALDVPVASTSGFVTLQELSTPIPD